MYVKLSEVLCAMSQVIDLGEMKELGHGQRVAVLTLAVADALEAFDVGASAELAVASLLHDIGLPPVLYSFYQRAGGQAEQILASYPSFQQEEGGLETTLARHVDLGARALEQLGYGAGATDAVLLHHRRLGENTRPLSTSPRVLGGEVLRLADHLDTMTYQLGTAAERQRRATEIIPIMGGDLVRHEVAGVALNVLNQRAIWEEIIFLDALNSRLDELFKTTYGLESDFRTLENHLRVLAEIVDSHSPYMTGHSFAVTRTALRIGEVLGLDDEQLRQLHLAGLLHGCGRLGVPCHITQKRGGLSPDEFHRLHHYPNATRDALAPLSALSGLIDEASTHREKLDGSGYPEGRAGDQIPLIGRILAVADTFVALTSERPYRPAYSRSRAVAIVQVESARLFDGLIADALEEVYREGF